MNIDMDAILYAVFCYFCHLNHYAVLHPAVHLMMRSLPFGITIISSKDCHKQLGILFMLCPVLYLCRGQTYLVDGGMVPIHR